MNRPDYIPQDYHRIKAAGTLTAFFGQTYVGSENGILYPRSLLNEDFKRADFSGLTQALYEKHKNSPQFQYDGRTELYSRGTNESWNAGEGLEQYQNEIDLIQEDIAQFQSYPESVLVELKLIAPGGYKDPLIMTFHADGDEYSKPTQRIATCYAGGATEFLRNEDAEKEIDHRMCSMESPRYRAAAGAPVYRFNLCDIWRQRNNSNGFENPFIHRAPDSGQARLMLMANCTLKGLSF